MNPFQNALSYFRRLLVTDATARVERYASGSGERVDEIDVLNISTAWACVRLLAGVTAGMPIEIKQETASGHKVIVKDHPLRRMLRRVPNTEQTAFDFWEGGSASLELKGNIVARKMRGARGDIVGLEPMAWDYTAVRRGRDNGLLYDFQGETFPASEVLHIRGFGGSPLGGLSTIAFGAMTFGLTKAVNKAASAAFANGARPTSIINAKAKKFTKEQRDEWEERIGARFQGAHNTGRPVILDDDMTWQQLTINAEDAQLLESRAFGVEEVCRMFGVPPFMVGHTKNSTSFGTGLSQQTYGFQKFSLLSRTRRIEQALEQQLLTPEDIANGISIEFNIEGLLRGDPKARSEFYRVMVSLGAMTINEVRRLEGLPPVDGGDLPRVQMQNAPLLDATIEEIQAALEMVRAGQEE